MARILIVGPDPEFLALLRFACEHVPHDVNVASGTRPALTLAQQERPDLTIIDTALPGSQALVLIQQLREASVHPIIMLTPRRSDAQQIACFDAGADDCVSLPCNMAVLLRRVRVHLCSASRRLPAPVRVDVGGSRIDFETNTLSGVRGHASLTPTEGRLLRHLLAAKGHPVPIRALAQRLWGPYAGADGAVKSHMFHLRRKLRATGGECLRVETVLGVGYRLTQWA